MKRSRYDQEIRSPKLQGLVRDCSDCRYKSDMHSTGVMYHYGPLGELSEPFSWFIEYYCDRCHAPRRYFDAEQTELIRDVLRDNGVTPK